MQLHIKTIENAGAMELYVSASPDANRDPAEESKQMFAAAYDVVRAHGARIAKERVFVPTGQLRDYHKARKAAVHCDDPPAPVDWLMAGARGGVGGLQLHAVRGADLWVPLMIESTTFGWAFSRDNIRWVTTGGLCVPCGSDPGKQAGQAFKSGEMLLAQAGMELKDVVRTWCFLDRILDWYGKFNEVRNQIFISRGLLRRGEESGDAPLVPASTGMGMTPVVPARFSLEMFAVSGANGQVQRYAAAGKQRCAFEYGSAFARAASAPTPAGRALFVSGTAAIDAEGRTCHVGDIKGQIRMTLDCLNSVVNSTGFKTLDTVQGIAYCKTPHVADVFSRTWARELPYPWIIVVGDVCRDDLLFEAEVTVAEEP